MHLDVTIPYKTLRNSVARMMDNDKGAADLVLFLKRQQAAGKLDFLHWQIDNETGVLQAVVWSFKGSVDIVRRCGDIAFCDSTHHLTKYAYSISSVTVIDFEGSTRTVLLSIHLHYNSETFKRILVSWHEAFGCSLPV